LLLRQVDPSIQQNSESLLVLYQESPTSNLAIPKSCNFVYEWNEWIISLLKIGEFMNEINKKRTTFSPFRSEKK
jgi:hypothetical protein